MSGLSEPLSRMGLNGAVNDGDGESGAQRTEEEYAQAQLTLRAIVSSKEAGVIIGKAGKTVADMRENTGVKAGVSKVVQGISDRVLTVSGTLEQLSRAYSAVTSSLLEGAPHMGMGGLVTNTGAHCKCLTVSCLRPENSASAF